MHKLTSGFLSKTCFCVCRMQIKQDGGCEPHMLLGSVNYFLPTDSLTQGKMTGTKHFYESRHSFFLLFFLNGVVGVLCVG